MKANWKEKGKCKIERKEESKGGKGNRKGKGKQIAKQMEKG